MTVRPLIPVLLTILLAGLLATPVALAQDQWREPFEGVRYLQRATSEPNRIHALVVDLCAVGISPRVTKAEDKGIRTSQFAARYGVQLAINGGFYNTANYAAIGLTMGDGQRWAGTGDDGTWGFIAFGQDNRAEISPPAEVVSTVPGWMHEIVSGRPLLVEAGQVVSEPCESHFCERHPRTAVGLDHTGRTLYKVVVDGRWPGVSRGMTRTELARLMIDLGAHRAINLDGGGSSTMFIEGLGVVNRPSDGTERVVSNHLGLTAGGSIDFARCCIPRAVEGATGVFADIADANWAKGFAEILYEEGITSGCRQDPPMFCPGCDLTRAQAAVLLGRGLRVEPLVPAEPTFEDVSADAFGAGYIEALVAQGIISGCSASPRRFCPSDGLTRGQAAVLIARAMGLETPGVDQPTFTDTPASAFYTAAVERLHGACVVSGCAQNPPRYCPSDIVTRAQFAALLVRGLELGGVRNCLDGQAPVDVEPGSDAGTGDDDAGWQSRDAGGNADVEADGEPLAPPVIPPGQDDVTTPTPPTEQGADGVEEGCGCRITAEPTSGPSLLLALLLGFMALARQSRRYSKRE
jgi:MYXO-CTERM domain-containing protein